MSIEAICWASRQTFGSPTRKLVMLLLSDYADNVWSCFPSQQTLATVGEMGERTVRRTLAELESDGWIRRERRFRHDGSRTSDRYYICGGNHGGLRFPVPSDLDPPPADLSDDDRDQRPDDVATSGQMTSRPAANLAGQEPSEEPPEDITAVVSYREQLTLVGAETPAAHHTAVGQNLGSDRDLAFVEFWRAYPHKAGKGQARKAWATARRRGVKPEVIVAGARRYADDPNRDPAFTRHPATWLNGEGWDDDPLPDRTARPGRAPTAMASTMSKLAQVAAAGGPVIPPHRGLEAPRAH